MDAEPPDNLLEEPVARESTQLTPLQRRLRESTQEFDFDALLHGVKSPPTTPEVITDPAPTPRHSNRWLMLVVIPFVGVAGWFAFSLRPVAKPAQRVPSVVVKPEPKVAMSPSRHLQSGLPDPSLTPGETRTIPALSPEIPLNRRLETFRRYALPEDTKDYVVVRLIPPSFGGSDGQKNLFPVTPWYRDLKQRLDKRLTELVRDGKWKESEAESALVKNWVQSAEQLGLRNFGANPTAISPTKRKKRRSRPPVPSLQTPTQEQRL